MQEMVVTTTVKVNVPEKFFLQVFHNFGLLYLCIRNILILRISFFQSYNPFAIQEPCYCKVIYCI